VIKQQRLATPSDLSFTSFDYAYDKMVEDGDIPFVLIYSDADEDHYYQWPKAEKSFARHVIDKKVRMRNLATITEQTKKETHIRCFFSGWILVGKEGTCIWTEGVL
tara:strand:+ start:393 stop:710 length:318 start_codon:yes stop_codon:yes gene_type:complete